MFVYVLHGQRLLWWVRRLHNVRFTCVSTYNLFDIIHNNNNMFWFDVYAHRNQSKVFTARRTNVGTTVILNMYEGFIITTSGSSAFREVNHAVTYGLRKYHVLALYLNLKHVINYPCTMDTSARWIIILDFNIIFSDIYYCFCTANLTKVLQVYHCNDIIKFFFVFIYLGYGNEYYNTFQEHPVYFQLPNEGAFDTYTHSYYTIRRLTHCCSRISHYILLSIP
ncbi:LOW QUALITY PROTEIN: hypothetical protein V1477_010385 [Vespula maculifrons]|uniref:Uncharacterized protein n=1 Tax=Vespula maculifrons TaxID=7453 RepID=A0ABD2C8E4_VESMC